MNIQVLELILNIKVYIEAVIISDIIFQINKTNNGNGQQENNSFESNARYQSVCS